MLFDCFTFFNELELLEIRLHELSDVVDFFVLAESHTTFSGRPKSLYYEESKRRFSDYQDRIIHVVSSDLETDDAWAREEHQRNSLLHGLRNCLPDDIVMVSDVDEIPKREAVKRAVGLLGIRV